MGILTNIVAAEDDEVEAIGDSLQPVDEWSGISLRDVSIAKIATLHSLLTGDRNLEVAGRPVPAGRFTLRTNQLAGWTESFHNRCGNVGLGDGSAMQLSNARFREFLINQQVATNRLVIP